MVLYHNNEVWNLCIEVLRRVQKVIERLHDGFARVQKVLERLHDGFARVQKVLERCKNGLVQ